MTATATATGPAAAAAPALTTRAGGPKRAADWTNDLLTVLARLYGWRVLGWLPDGSWRLLAPAPADRPGLRVEWCLADNGGELTTMPVNGDRLAYPDIAATCWGSLVSPATMANRIDDRASGMAIDYGVIYPGGETVARELDTLCGRTVWAVAVWA